MRRSPSSDNMNNGHEDIPHEAEEIQIHVELPNGKRVWWPATVEDVGNGDEKRGILAYASVVFHAAFDYPPEKCTAEILSNRTVRHETRAWVEGTWKRPEDGEPDDCVRNKIPREHHGDKTTSWQRTRESKTSKQQSGDDQKLYSPIIKKKSTTKRKKQSNTTCSQERQTDARQRGIEKNSEVPAVEKEIRTEMQEMRHRMAKLERKQQTNTQCNHMELINERVLVFRGGLGDEVLRQCTSTPRPSPAGNNAAYAHIFSRGVVKYQTKVDYKFFRYLLDDMEACVPYGSVLYTPSNDRDPSNSVRKERHVIFKTAGVFFDWLSIPKDINRKGVLIEEKNRNRTDVTPTIRIMGGVRWNKDNADAKVHIMVGRSCSDVPTSTVADETGDQETEVRDKGCAESGVECIAYASGHCEEGGDVFVDYPEVGKGNTGDLSEASIESSFSISWNAIPPLKRGIHAITPHFTDGVQYGWLTLRYPYALVRGHGMCSRMKEIIDRVELKGVL